MKKQEKFNFVLSMLGTDNSDLHGVEQVNVEMQRERGETIVKTYTMWDGIDNTSDELTVANEEFSMPDDSVHNTVCIAEKIEPELSSSSDSELENETHYQLKSGSLTFGCTFCLKDFLYEHEYNDHMSMHLIHLCNSGGDLSHVAENRQEVLILDDDSSADLVYTSVSRSPLSARRADNNKKNMAPTEKVITVLESKVVLEKIDGKLENGLSDRNNTVWFVCDVCENIFKQKSDLVDHIKTHAEEKVFSCKLCAYKTNYKINLVRHMRSHTSEKPFSCRLCEYKFARSCQLRPHMQTHTGEKPYLCNICTHKTARNYNLMRHMRTHMDEIANLCKSCGYKCADHSTLVKHMSAHTGTVKTPYSCNLCKYKCTQIGHLVLHMVIHASAKPRVCKFCEFECDQRSTLVTHMKTHKLEKRYLCKFCKYKSADNSHLKRHMLTHTKKKRFSCKLCEYKCIQSGSLVRHMRTHTG